MTWDDISRSDAVHRYLADVVHDFPKMKSVWLVDQSGIIRNSSAVFPTPPVSLADRDYFIALREKNVGMFVGEPVRSRVLGEDIFHVAQRRSSDSGAFDGLVVVSPLPSYFTNYWKQVVPDESALELLVHRNGTILARRPTMPIGTPPLNEDSPLFREINRRDSGILQGLSPVDSQVRLTAFERIEGVPVYIAHGIRLHSLNQIWYRHLLIYGVFFTIGTFALIVLAALAGRLATREAAAVRQWQGTAQKLAKEAEQSAAIAVQLQQARKMEAFGQFTGGVAHDFNNILQVIIGSMDILQNRIAASEKPLLAVALEAARRGKQLIESMLAFARQQPLRSEVFDLNVTVSSMQTLLRPLLKPGIRLDIVPSATPCMIEADRNQTELAILNLALNARDAMPDNGELAITVRCQILAGEPDGLIGHFGGVAIKDSGVGMSPELQAKVFEPFFTTKGPSKGTGLGLSMVYGFAKQTRGTVTIDSIVGRGTTVTLYLPSGLDPVRDRTAALAVAGTLAGG